MSSSSLPDRFCFIAVFLAAHSCLGYYVIAGQIEELSEPGMVRSATPQNGAALSGSVTDDAAPALTQSICDGQPLRQLGKAPLRGQTIDSDDWTSASCHFRVGVNAEAENLANPDFMVTLISEDIE